MTLSKLPVVLLIFLIGAPMPFAQLVGQVQYVTGTGGAESWEYLPKVDIRQFFTPPFPTATQAQSQDFGSVLNAALVFAAGGACVDLSGIDFVGTLYMDSNPFVGTSQPCVVGGNIIIVTSVMISTPSSGLDVEGFPSAGGPAPGGLYFTACNVGTGCGTNHYPLYTASTGSTGCNTVGGLNCVASSTPSSSALTTYSIGQVTVTNGSTTVTATGSILPTFTTAMVGGFFISNCISNSCTPPITPSSGNSYTAARIVAAGSGTVGSCTASSTTLCLESPWSGTSHSLRSYIIWNPNTSVVVCDGCLGPSADFDTFGHVWRNVAIDIAGVPGAVGYFARACEERCEYDNFRVSMQVTGNTYSSQGAAGACGVWDGTLRGSSGIDGKQNVVGTGHASQKTIECVVGNNVGGTSSYGWVVTEYDLIQQKTTSGPNDFQVGTVVGTSGSQLADGLFLDGFNRGYFYGGHIESVSNDAIEVGLNNPVYGITISGIDFADTNANNVIEFHAGASGNIAIGTRREIAGCIVADDNLASPALCTAMASSSSATQSEPLYAQAGNDGNGAVFGGGIDLNSTAVYEWGVGTGMPLVLTPDTGLSRLAPGWVLVGNGTGQNQSGVIQSANSTRLTSATTIFSTSFATTNLAFLPVPVNTNVSFHCDIVWEWQQHLGPSTITFGMGMNNAPTSLWVESQIYNNTNVAPVSSYTVITSNTITAITAATTPAASGVAYVFTLFGVLSTGASNPVTLTLYGESSNSSSALVVEPGSTCFLTP